MDHIPGGGVDDDIHSQESEDIEARVAPRASAFEEEDADDEVRSNDSENIETSLPPENFEKLDAAQKRRRNAVCAAPLNTAPCDEPRYQKALWSTVQLTLALEQCPIFSPLNRQEVTEICDTMKVEFPRSGDQIIKQGENGDAMYVVLDGAADCYYENDRNNVRSVREVSSIFGELSVLWNTPRAMSVSVRSTGGACMLGKLQKNVFQKRVTLRQFRNRETKEELLRNVSLLETLGDEALAKLADVVKEKNYAPGDKIITQGDEGDELFVMQSGETVVQVRTADDVQEHRKYHEGDFFGERALLTGNRRAASIIALSPTQTISFTRRQFERLLGGINLLQEVTYLSDPRKLIANFYAIGDKSGPYGTVKRHKFPGDDVEVPDIPKAQQTHWFAVYRPTSRDAIAKMLSGVAVGKGLNVKGKSAKKNMLSGYVPFLQISNNDHKPKIEQSPPDARLAIYYKSEHSRNNARKALTAVLQEANLNITDKAINDLDDYLPDVFGLELPEPLLRESYIMRPDISPAIGWETGRPSEPAFMDMNLHAIREASDPKVVLFQYREDDPMNPRGLLIAYAEQFVKPVVSDFDTFTVASKGMQYPDLLPPEQAKLVTWALGHAEEIFNNPGTASWTSRWLEVLKKENEKGFHPNLPRYGFADKTSYRLVEDVIDVTKPCGAVRHGAECFNFYFPQELDDEYLVVWEGFQGKPWAYFNERELRWFLLEKAKEGYAFPLNPVWPVRDYGWYDVWRALRKNSDTKQCMDSWFPASAGILKRIEAIRKVCPKGFYMLGPDGKPLNPQFLDKAARKRCNICPTDKLGRPPCPIS